MNRIKVKMNYKLKIELIKLQMIQKGYSISRLSKESQISKSTISRLLNQMGSSRAETIYNNKSFTSKSRAWAIL